MRMIVTDEDFMDDEVYPTASYVIAVCECGTETRYYQDPPGHRTFDEVLCSNSECRKVIGKT